MSALLIQLIQIEMKMEVIMKVNRYIKSLLIALALIFGTQTVQASVLETFVKPMVNNKIATIMTITTTLLSYICYCLIVKLNTENIKSMILQEELDETTTLLDEIYANYQQMMNPSSEDLTEIFLKEESDIEGLSYKDIMNAYLNYRKILRIPKN